jgi:hypothetical protein
MPRCIKCGGENGNFETHTYRDKNGQEHISHLHIDPNDCLLILQELVEMEPVYPNMGEATDIIKQQLDITFEEIAQIMAYFSAQSEDPPTQQVQPDPNDT